MNDAKMEKIEEIEVAAILASAVATRLGSAPPPDPQKADPKTQALCLETWNIFQDFQAAVYAGVESNSGKIWSDPVAGISAAATAGVSGANAAFAGLFGQLVNALVKVPGLPGDVTGILTQLIGKIPGTLPGDAQGTTLTPTK